MSIILQRQAAVLAHGIYCIYRPRRAGLTCAVPEGSNHKDVDILEGACPFQSKNPNLRLMDLKKKIFIPGKGTIEAHQVGNQNCAAHQCESGIGRQFGQQKGRTSSYEMCANWPFGGRDASDATGRVKVCQSQKIINNFHNMDTEHVLKLW